MFKRYCSACGIVHGNQNDTTALHRFCSQIQFLCAFLLLHRCNSGGICQTWEAPTQRGWQNHALFHEKEWGQCWWWARLTAARKISNQLVDDSRHKFVMCKWLWGLYWCWHVHNSEIFLVDNVCIHHDCIQKIHKHSYPPPPRLTVDCIIAH